MVNASPDSLHRDSVVTTPDEAVARGRALLADGAVALDLGGQGTTYVAEEVADEVRRAAAEAGRLLFGTFPVDFPLDVAVVGSWADAG